MAGRRMAATGLLALMVGALGAQGTAAAAITDLVAPYLAGEVQVWGSRHRNDSCSITRNVANQAPGPRRVIQWVTWDGHLAPVMPQPGTSAMDGDEILDVGEESSITFTNDGWISPTATGMRLHTLVLIPDGVAQIGAQVSEDIEPCLVDTTSSSSSSTTGPPPVETTLPAAPPDTAPPAGEAPPETSTPSVEAPPPSSPPPTAVLTGQAGNVPGLSRTLLPSTGSPVGGRAVAGLVLMLTGTAGWIVSRTLRELNRP
jgi:hypothetical protein